MSTSRSDDSAESPLTAKNGGSGVGVAGLFKRAVEAHAEKNTPAATVAAGVQLTTCSHCGAPRQRAELVCHFCEEKL